MIGFERGINESNQHLQALSGFYSTLLQHQAMTEQARVQNQFHLQAAIMGQQSHMQALMMTEAGKMQQQQTELQKSAMVQQSENMRNYFDYASKLQVELIKSNLSRQTELEKQGMVSQTELQKQTLANQGSLAVAVAQGQNQYATTLISHRFDVFKDMIKEGYLPPNALALVVGLEKMDPKIFGSIGSSPAQVRADAETRAKYDPNFGTEFMKANADMQRAAGFRTQVQVESLSKLWPQVRDLQMQLMSLPMTGEEKQNLSKYITAYSSGDLDPNSAIQMFNQLPQKVQPLVQELMAAKNLQHSVMSLSSMGHGALIGASPQLAGQLHQDIQQTDPQAAQHVNQIIQSNPTPSPQTWGSYLFGDDWSKFHFGVVGDAALLALGLTAGGKILGGVGRGLTWLGRNFGLIGKGTEAAVEAGAKTGGEILGSELPATVQKAAAETANKIVPEAVGLEGKTIASGTQDELKTLNLPGSAEDVWGPSAKPKELFNLPGMGPKDIEGETFSPRNAPGGLGPQLGGPQIPELQSGTFSPLGQEAQMNAFRQNTPMASEQQMNAFRQNTPIPSEFNPQSNIPFRIPGGQLGNPLFGEAGPRRFASGYTNLPGGYNDLPYSNIPSGQGMFPRESLVNFGQYARTADLSDLTRSSVQKQLGNLSNDYFNQMADQVSQHQIQNQNVNYASWLKSILGGQ